ncbi:hypothetical protein HUJ04_011082 [Dendroctonus ponderosae]|nr:hypothetical protein HUJ04_011082 [Dendroctonus ponderosae]
MEHRFDSTDRNQEKRKCTENVGEYIHFFTGVPKEGRAARGVSILIRKDWKSKINNWEAVYENILTVNLKVHGYNIIILAAYTPPEDERVGIKQEIVEKLDETLEDVGKNI